MKDQEGFWWIRMRYRDIKPKRRGYVHAELFNEGEYMGWVISESIFSFLEMFISYFFASGIFRRKIKGSKTIYVMILFSVFGTVLLTLREYAFAWIPDFVPAVFVFTLYAIVMCQTKWWKAVSWALVN
ncbi:hypothetical protein NSB25_23795 [Acetatifactor muris]|nr:hypothetical protein [Acetatifactor muris]MCR2050274.1 hypothetical protein [Acetatifactor muris]